MSVLSRSVVTAQRGRTYRGTPDFGAGGISGAEEISGARIFASSCSGGAPDGYGREPGAVSVLYPRTPFTVQPAQRTGRSRRRMSFTGREAGMATAEYAIATLAAVAFAALLVAVLGSGEVRALLMGLIRSALTLG